ncbi:MAG: extracellular solute-binding protein [Anaerolineaceae bacterium]|nr:extracellular solute-binding protein [Anaerolineaceae bacterium]
MKKSLFAIFAVLMIAAMALGACTPATPAPTQAPAAEPTKAPAAEPTQAPAAEPTKAAEPANKSAFADVKPAEKIVYWHNQTGPKSEALKALIDEFNKTNEWKIQVEPVEAGSYGDIYKKMTPILNTKEVPDIVVGYQNNVAAYNLNNSIVDMTPYMNDPVYGISEADQKDFVPAFFAQDVYPTYGNARLGLAPNRSMEVLYYNADWLKELGYDKAPATPEEFKEMALKAVSQKFTKAKGEKAKGFELWADDASHFAAWVFAFGGDIYDSAANQFTYNSEPAVKAAEFLQDLYKTGAAVSPDKQYGDQGDFGNGDLLFYIGSTSGIPFVVKGVSEGAQFNWDIAPLPHTGAEPVQNIYGASISMPKSGDAGRELAAWLFIRWFTSPEVNAKWAATSNYFPSRQSSVKFLDATFQKLPQFKTAYDMLKFNNKFEPPVPGYDPIRVMVGEAVHKFIDDTATDVKATLDELNTGANAKLAEFMAQIKK